MSGKRKHVVLRKPNGRVRAMIFIGGSGPISEAVLTLRLADCTMQDAPMKVLAKKTVELQSRPSHDWVIVDFDFEWPEDRSAFRLSEMSWDCDITGKDGKLQYYSQVAHPYVDLTTGLEWSPVVVVQKV